MQNRYVGDLGDFGKYGLLKAICSPGYYPKSPNLSLGIVWYLVPNEVNNSDGRHTSYLETTHRIANSCRDCDPLLYDLLQKIVLSGQRNVTSIRDYQVLPPETVFYETVLSFEPEGNIRIKSRKERLALRDAWHRGALELTASCDVVFADPDNGIEVNVKPYQKYGSKYTFFNELLPYVRRNQSLVIYHHIGRRGSALEQVRGRLAQISEKLHLDGFALLYHRGSARAFFILPSQCHREVILRRCSNFLESPWSQHFELIALSSFDGSL